MTVHPVLRPRGGTVERPDAKTMPGIEGFWVFVFGDLAMFTLVFLTFAVARNGDAADFEEGRRLLDVDRGGLNTLILLSSSACVAAAVARVRVGDADRARAWLAGGIAGGIAFVVLKVSEYVTSFEAGHTPVEGEFFVFYFALTGLHLLHVIAGCLILGAFWLRLRRGPLRSHVGFETAGIYWHLVDFLWLIIFPLLYLIR